MSRTYPHMCRDDHVEIGHSDGEHEQCPLCRAIGALQFIADGYDNQDVNHVDFRVKAYQVATETLETLAPADRLPKEPAFNLGKFMDEGDDGQ